MIVALDDNKPTGVFISIDELEHLDQHLAELYQLRDKLKTQSVFDLSTEQMEERLRPTASNLVSEAFQKGSFVSYLQTDPSIPAAFIHEYKDGRLEYVDIDILTAKAVVVKSTR